MNVVAGHDEIPAAESWPPVSVVMPVFNEERHLRASVARVLDQRYPGQMEIILAVAPSPDRTEKIAVDLASHDARIRIVPNPTGRTPAGLNAAIGASRYDILVRVDGHGELSPGYIEKAVTFLEQTGAANVGGIMDARGRTSMEQAIAVAMRSPFGIGAAPFHTGGEAGPADSVYLGVFRRDVLERLGGFDEEFHRAQDWELNYRIRRAGERVWFSPDLTVVYRPRSSVRELSRQFYGSGGWRRQVIARYPETASARYLAAPSALVMVVGGTAMAVLGGTTGPAWLRVGLLAPITYAAVVVVGGTVASRGQSPVVRLLTPVVMATMHASWAWGFLRGQR
jgi:glycosyltransferase involved in cell wall biosynthesis